MILAVKGRVLNIQKVYIFGQHAVSTQKIDLKGKKTEMQQERRKEREHQVEAVVITMAILKQGSRQWRLI